MAFPLNRSAGSEVMAALAARGVTAAQLAEAIDVPRTEATAMLSSGRADLTVEQSKRIEQMTGVSFATLAFEGLYRTGARTPEQLALLDSAADLFHQNERAAAPVHRARRVS